MFFFPLGSVFLNYSDCCVVCCFCALSGLFLLMLLLLIDICVFWNNRWQQVLVFRFLSSHLLWVKTLWVIGGLHKGIQQQIRPPFKTQKWDWFLCSCCLATAKPHWESIDLLLIKSNYMPSLCIYPEIFTISSSAHLPLCVHHISTQYLRKILNSDYYLLLEPVTKRCEYDPSYKAWETRGFIMFVLLI